ncbi:unnamed protein product, partial [Larinioides sclopetarius]
MSRSVKVFSASEAPVSAFRPVFPGPRFAAVSPFPLQTRYMIGCSVPPEASMVFRQIA